MALGETRTWLIAYDITNPRRLARIHRLLTKHAVPVQYSLFVTQGSTYTITELRKALAAEINAKTDDVRIYPLPKALEVHHYGRSELPEGLQWLDGTGHRQIAQFIPKPPKADS